MPIYEYECPKCGVIEVIQKITEPPLKKCPDCKSKIRRLISRSNFHLKGTGWYATDYKRSDNGGNGGNGKKKHEESSSPKVDLAKTDNSKQSHASKT
jgi:putative FmdB family regulatory protein